MIQLGKTQILKVVKKVEFGVYIADDDDKEERILLPAKQVPEGTETGDEIEVFVYRDSKDRMIATTKKPLIELGQTAVLRVAQTGTIGAFLDWGLEKDLLLPFRMQTIEVREGDECLVALYIDKSQRLCAMMNVYEYLQKDAPYGVDDLVTGRIYEDSDNFGMFVAVDDRYSALIPKRECYGDLRVGDVVTARVIKVLEDGRLELSVRQKAHLQMEDDAKLVLEAIEGYAGVLPFNDKASPEVIKRELGLSKSAFKRAVGRLLKENQIEITDKNIRLK